MTTRLGLDVGTNSLGWCLLEVDDTFGPISIINSGSRIFSNGRDTQSDISLKAGRRVARQARRRRDRYLKRRKALMVALVKYGLMPEETSAQKALEKENPYFIRRNAIKERCDPHHIGRALFHLNQRRGFKSNRKTADNEAGVVKQSIQNLEYKISEEGAKTLGALLADRIKKRETVRARRLGNNKTDTYDLYPSRAIYEEEFNKIWDRQAEYHPEIYHDDAREEIRHIIFDQRKLKPQKVGLCSFLGEHDEKRIAKALPSYQQFRIYQEVLNLNYIDKWQRGHRVVGNKPLFDTIIANLDQKKKYTFKAMSALIRKLNIKDYDVSFNLQSEKRKDLEGNTVACLMRDPKRVGPSWDEWSLERQDDLIKLLINDDIEDEDLNDILTDQFGIDEANLEEVISTSLPKGHASLSKAAIDLILPVMIDQGLSYWEAVKEAGLGEHNQSRSGRDLDKKLKYYAAVLTTDVLPGSGDPKHGDEKRYGTISNPTVHIALNQIRAVVNELIRRYGKPDEIAIELARDLPLGPEKLKDERDFQSKRQKINERINQELENCGVDISRSNRQKYELWESLSADPMERRCVFTGDVISVAQLFSEEIEVEHLLPFSRTFDDGMANKTVAYRKANRDKGNQAPYEAFGHSPSGYDWAGILNRTATWPKSKKWRFSEDAMKRFEEENKNSFAIRQISDTGYIGRYTGKYLASIVPENKIWVVTGRLTSLLRGHWGLNSVLHDESKPEDDKKKKLRDDHRHHAIDAIVIAMTSRSMLQRVSTAAKKAEEMSISKLFADKQEIDPWPDFRKDVQAQLDHMIVSHRSRKKIQGPLHNATAYGMSDRGAVVRKGLDAITSEKHIQNIKDDFLRHDLNEETYGLSGADFKAAIEAWGRRTGVRRLKCYYTGAGKTPFQKEKLIPIRNEQGQDFKFLEPNGNAYIDIYVDDKGKWHGEITSRFNAHQKGFTAAWQQQFPAHHLVMRLRINDVIKIDKDGEQTLLRVQKLVNSATTPEIYLAGVNEANCDARARDTDDSFQFTRKSPSGLQKDNAVKIYVSPTGLLKDAPKGRFD